MDRVERTKTGSWRRSRVVGGVGWTFVSDPPTSIYSGSSKDVGYSLTYLRLPLIYDGKK